MSAQLPHPRILLVVAAALLAGCASSPRAPLAATVAPVIRQEQLANVSERALLVRADSAWAAEAYGTAALLYQAAVARDSSNSRAVFRLATLRSWSNQLDEGIKLYRRYVALEPRDVEGRLALARAIAWSGKYASAIAVYDSVLSQNGAQRGAVLGRAQTLGWAGRLNESLTIYRSWLTSHPSDREASLDYARALAWNGDLGQAERMYTELSRTGDADAQKGLARVVAWRGELDRSEHAWHQVLEVRPHDPEALTGLAQTLRWQGRQSDAEEALVAALETNPDYGDARTLLRSVQADLRPSVTVTGHSTNDSDTNRATNLLVDYVNPWRWNTTFGGRYTERRANFSAIDSRVHSTTAFLAWQRGSWQLRAAGGAVRHSSNLGPSSLKSVTLGSGSFQGAGRLGPVLKVGFGVSRSPFDETALLIANGVISSEYSGEAELALPGRLSLSGGAGQARLTAGTQDNLRRDYSSSLRWKYNRTWSIALGGRQFGYDSPSTDGYFAPRRYTLGEISTRGHLGGELGWNSDADLGLGQQSIELFGSGAASRFAERASLSLGYRLDPSQEITLLGGYANVAAPGQTKSSEYNFYSLSLRVRLGL
jgi:tetratricopeptide (TPR) repeat protein